MIYRFFFITGAALLFFALITVRTFAAPAVTPTELVDNFHKALLVSMKSANTTDVRQRFDMLTPVVLETFHSKLMIQVASGSYWRKASQSEQDALVSAFTNLSAATYAAQFNDYSGQRFETIGEKPGPQKDILVHTKIVNPDGDTVALTYITRKKDDRWRVIDVLVDTGISNLARMRSEYRHVLKSKGVDGLLTTLNEKTSTLLQN